jgi:hypothetical protein
MNICPVCNGLMEYTKYCPRCGEKMQIYDRVENYYDDYSPYLSYELTDLNDGDASNICSHFWYCRNCGNQDIVKIRNIVE